MVWHQHICLILSSCISLQGFWDRRHRACCVHHFHHQPSSMVIGLFATLLLRCGTIFHFTFAAPLHLVCLNRDWKRTFSSSISTQLLCNITISISCHDVFLAAFHDIFRWNVWQGDVLEPLPFLCFIITIMHVLHVISRCNVYSCAIMWLSPITAGWSSGTSPLSPIHVCHNPDPAVPYHFFAVQLLWSMIVFILMTFMTFMTFIDFYDILTCIHLILLLNWVYIFNGTYLCFVL